MAENTPSELEQRIARLESELVSEKLKRKAAGERLDVLERVTDGVPMLITCMDREERYLFVNDAYAKWYGMPREDLIGKRASDVLSPDVYARASSYIRKVLSGQSVSYENRVVAKDGVERLISVNYEPHFRDAEVIGFYVAILDITGIMRAEETLKRSEANFRRFLDDSPLGARIVSESGDTIYANRALLDIYGYDDMAELQTTSANDRYTPESYTEYLVRRSGRKKGEFVPSEYEIAIIRKDGNIRHLQVFRKDIIWNGEPQFQVLYQDITERKKAEAERNSLRERLQRAEKLEVLGRMAGKVAHDVNNVLGSLTGYSELLLMQLPEGQPARSNAEKVMQSAKKGAAIIQDLLTLARRGVQTSEVMNLNRVVADFMKSPTLEKIKADHAQVAFKTEFDDLLFNIRGSSVHLEKALLNLVYNAAEAITGRGEVVIKTSNLYLDRTIRGYDEVKQGDYVILTVSDTGTGICEEDREKIFEPFYTKKTMGKSGTGLGLSIVWGTVKDHNGYIDLQSKVGEGTTFTLYFPVTRQTLMEPRQKIPREQYAGKGESILVVDDVDEQREIASGLLTSLGYKVHAVAGGEEAVAYLKGQPVDILVLDMIMAPGIDGLETYRRVLEVHPGQKAILVSGYSETERVRKAQKLGAGAYVKKPYLLETIGLAIRDELNRSTR